MMKYFLFFSLFYFLNCIDTSAAPINYADSSVNKSSYKQSKQYFLDNYGKDDSTRALINYFFGRRKEAFYETVVPVVAAGVSVLLLNLMSRNEDLGALGISVAIPLVLTVYAAPVYIIIGQVNWLSFSRKRLSGILTNYNSGNSLPKTVTRRKAFKYEFENLNQIEHKGEHKFWRIY